MNEHEGWASQRASALMRASEPIAEALGEKRAMSAQALAATMERVCGARGWSPRDAQEAYEIGMVRHIEAQGAQMHARTQWSWTSARRDRRNGARRAPAPGRSHEQRSHDHYSTPWGVGWAMVEAADIEPGDRVLEPSAGLGILVALGRARFQGAHWHVNEVEPVRHEVLKNLFPDATHTCVDAGALEMHLAGERPFDTVVMNPPFSASGKDRRTAGEDARHVASALGVTKPKGRVVALTSMRTRPGERAWDEAVARQRGTLVWSKKLDTAVWRRRALSVKTCVSVIEHESDYAALEGQFEWRAQIEETVEDAETLLGGVLTQLPGRTDRWWEAQAATGRQDARAA